MKKTILVVGALGRQGGAVIRALSKTGFAVKGLVRDPQSQESRRLAHRGTHIAGGDLDDMHSLLLAMEDIYGVFSAIDFPDGDLEKEQARGKRVAEAARRAGIKHLIYSSVGGADRRSSLPHMESKRCIEEHIRASLVPHTIFRPVAFMENLESEPGIDRLSLLKNALGERPLQMIAVEDVGKWVAHAFAAPGQFMSKGVEIAGDELTYTQMEAAYTKVRGSRPRSLRLQSFVFARMGFSDPMFMWLQESGFQADLRFCRETIKDSLTFEQWLASRQ